MFFAPQAVPEKYKISIKFTEELSLPKITSKLSQMTSPHVIIWYIGSYGLKKACVDFYRENLISPLLSCNSEVTLWLTDLTAWYAFKSPKGSIYKTNSCCQVIQNFNDQRVKCLLSSEIFQRMFQISDEYIVSHFTNVFTKASFQHVSTGHPLIGIKVKEIFSKDAPVLNALINMDVTTAYSAIQFLEGCLIVETIAKWVVAHSKRDFVEAVFVLPNDELKYYQVEEELFKKSVEIMVTQMCRKEGVEQLNLKLNFSAFKFSDQKEHRPYNIPGGCVKKNKLSLGDIIGDERTIFSSEEERAS